MKRFYPFLKALKIILLIAVFGLIASSIYNDFQYSRWISMPAAEVLSNPNDRYQNVFSLSEERSDTFHETFVNLCGNHDWGQLSLPDAETVVFESNPLLGTVRLLITGSSPGNVVYDALISAAQEIHLKAGSYQVYLIGSWFTGSIEMQYGTGSFLSRSIT